MPLMLEPNLANPDDLYAALLHLHDALSAEESARLNFRLLLILMNHIGDEATIRAAMAAASESANSQT